MRGILGLCVVLVWGLFEAPAQVVVVPDSLAGRNNVPGTVTIQCDVDSAIVIMDSVKTGVTPLVVKDVQPGLHRLKIIHPDMTNWLTASIVDSVQVQPGEDRILRYTFGKRYLVLSIPSGAQLFEGDSLVGSTPCLLSVSGTDSPALTMLKRPGFDSARVDFSEAKRGVVTVALKRTWSADQREEESEETTVTEKHSTLSVYLAGAVTVGFGAAAAYFKIQADDKNDQYLQNFSSSSRSQVRIYDTAAAICLSFAEVGFGFLTYFLLTE